MTRHLGICGNCRHRRLSRELSEGRYCEFSYQGTKGDTLFIKTDTNPRAMAPILTILHNGLDKEDGVAEILDYTLPDSGTYRIRVQADIGGSFQLHLVSKK